MCFCTAPGQTQSASGDGIRSHPWAPDPTSFSALPRMQADSVTHSLDEVAVCEHGIGVGSQGSDKVLEGCNGRAAQGIFEPAGAQARGDEQGSMRWRHAPCSLESVCILSSASVPLLPVPTAPPHAHPVACLDWWAQTPWPPAPGPPAWPQARKTVPQAPGEHGVEPQWDG